MNKTLNVREKALQVNLNKKIYGAFAEIGAGQDVAVEFFKAGGASGTIAKTMSAYDMIFSNVIYGTTTRFVSRERLEKMLSKEYRLLEERLGDTRPDTTFFAFANTVEALNFRKTNQGKGWLGLRFQLRPDSPPNDCIIHILLHDNNNLLQQEAIGIIGVNLIYGCYHLADNPEELVYSLMDNLDISRIQVDMFSLKGPDFKKHDNRLLNLKLVKKGMSKTVMFCSNGRMEQAAEVLYKRPILLLRGRFKPVTHVNIDMLENARKQFEANIKSEEETKAPITITELTLYNLKGTGTTIDDKDFLDRVDLLNALGHRVLISDYYEYYRVVTYLSNINRNRKIGIVLGIKNLRNIFNEDFYRNLGGGILESFGHLFSKNVKLYVYPAKKDNKITKIDDVRVPAKLKGLYLYLKDNARFEDIVDFDASHLDIYSDDVLKYLRENNPIWKTMVPEKVAELIEKDHLFY